jgi:hypothetical protein
MSTITSAPAAKLAAFTATDFPSNQNVVVPNAGSGNISLYLTGLGSTLSLYYAPNGDSQVFYGENNSYPNIPLPAGISTYLANPGFNMQWSSSTGGFKLVWGTS